MTTTKCATCHRVYDPDARDARHWIARPDGRGLMCRWCERRVRRGELIE